MIDRAAILEKIKHGFVVPITRHHGGGFQVYWDGQAILKYPEEDEADEQLAQLRTDAIMELLNTKTRRSRRKIITATADQSCSIGDHCTCNGPWLDRRWCCGNALEHKED